MVIFLSCSDLICDIPIFYSGNILCILGVVISRWPPVKEYQYKKKVNVFFSVDTLEHIKDRLRDFATERDWDQFHSPKNLAMALIVEVAELVEHFQWMKEEESASLSPDKLEEIEQELADIQIYLIRIADVLNIELISAVDKKIQLNADKYPVEKVQGSSKKYSEYTS